MSAEVGRLHSLQWSHWPVVPKGKGVEVPPCKLLHAQYMSSVCPRKTVVFSWYDVLYVQKSISNIYNVNNWFVDFISSMPSNH